jgi:hypothetical protein
MPTILPHGCDRTTRRVSVRGALPDYAEPISPIVRQGDPVTSQPQPVPGEGKTAGQFLRPLRDLAAYALVGATAVLLFVAIIRLIPDGAGQFGYRTEDSFYGFVNLATISFPLGAVLLALLVQPRHPKAQLIVVAALVEYAVMAFFGVLFGVLIGLINRAGNSGGRGAFEELLVRGAWLAVFGIAGYAVYQIWRGMFAVVRPKPQPGVYGQPAAYQPGAYPGQPGYAPSPGYAPAPGYPQQAPAYPQQAPAYPQQAPAYPPPPPGFAQPPYGQAPQNPPWNQPAVPMPAPTSGAAPQPAPTSGAAPQPAPTSGAAPHATPTPGAAPTSGAAPQPASAPPAAPPGPYAPQPGNPQAAAHIDPTRIAPQHDPMAEPTEKLNPERPGFGPADQDPPRQ